MKRLQLSGFSGLLALLQRPPHSRHALWGLFVFVVLYVAQPTAGNLAVPEGIKFEQGIEFSNVDSQHLQLNLAVPLGAGPFPAVVCIHGGGFYTGKRDAYNELCFELAKRGYVALTVTYRLAPEFPFPAAVQDCKTAVRWLRAHAAQYNVDPERIGITGSSAGGHLAQFLGVTAEVRKFEGEGYLEHSSAVACVVNLFGPSDFTRSQDKSVDAAEVLPMFFRGILGPKRREYIIGSPLYWVTPNAAPTLCIHGTADKHVPLEQTEWLVDRLKASAVEAELLKLEGAGHGFHGGDLEAAKAALFKFFELHLHP